MASSTSTFERPNKLGTTYTFFSPKPLGVDAKKPVNSLEEMALYAIFDQCDFNVHKIAAFISTQKNRRLNIVLNQHIPHFKRLTFRVNTLCAYIANADLKGAKDFLDANKQLLPLLFKFKTTVKSQRGHLYENCNALQLIKKTGDVGRDGCELFLVSDEQPRNTTKKKLFLSSDVNNAHSPLRYMVNNVEETIQPGYGNDQLDPNDFYILKAMYPDGLCQGIFRRDCLCEGLYLSIENLTGSELRAYAALLRVTKKRGHTKFVKEDGIREMIKKNYFKYNKAEFENLSQLSEVDFTLAEKRRTQDKRALETIFNVISQSDCSVDCVKALSNFKEYLKARSLMPITTFGVDMGLLLEALAMTKHHAENVENFGGYYGRKAKVVCEGILGPIENIISVYSQMAIAQGVYFKQSDGEALWRDLHPSWIDPCFQEFLSRLGWGWTEDLVSGSPIDSGWIDDLGRWVALRAK